MQCVQQRFSKVGIFLLGLFGALIGAFILSPSAHATIGNEYYQYIKADDTIRVTGGMLDASAPAAGLHRTGSNSFEGGVTVQSGDSRVVTGNAVSPAPCHYTLQVTDIVGDLRLPSAKPDGSFDAKVGFKYQSQNVGDDRGDKGCKAGDVFGDAPVINDVDEVADGLPPSIVVNTVPDPAGNAGGNACPGSNAPAGTDCSTIPAGCPGSTQTPKPGAPPVDPASCKFQAVTNPEEGAEPDPCPIDKDTALRWIFCPVVELGKVITNGLDIFIDTYLQSSNDIFRNNTTGTSPTTGATGSLTSSYRKAWETFRTFGVSLVVIAGLVMVASEALGLGIIDAYTIRKVLPRLVVAVIGISLSWDLMDFLTTFFDALGHAAGSIIYTSFSIDPVKGVDVGGLIAGNLLVLIGGVGGAVLLGPMGIVSLLTTLILAMLVGVAVLIARQAIIVAAVVMAPLAIAAYILPNTNKLANFWWSTYTSMMFLYPIATGLIALCKAMGSITITTNKAFSGIVGMVFFFAGYALLPAAFRLSGGLIATLGGIANDKSRGAFDRLKKGRQQRMAGNAQDLKDGRRFKGRNALSNRLNTISGGVGAFSGAEDKTGFLFSRGARGRTARQEAFSNHRAEAGARYADSTAGKLARFKDSARQAQSYRTEEEARANLANDYIANAALNGRVMTNEDANRQAEEAIAAAKANGGFSATIQQTAAKQLAASGTGMMNVAHAAQVIERASGGNASLREELVGDVRSSSKSAGRYDIGGMGHGTLSGLAQATNGGTVAPPETQIREALVDAARSTHSNTLLQGKPAGTRAIANALTQTVDRNMAIANDTTRGDHEREMARGIASDSAAKLGNLRQYEGYAPEVATDALRHGTVGRGAAPAGFISPTGPVIQEHVADLHDQSREREILTTTDRAGNQVPVVDPDPVRNPRGDPTTVVRPNYQPGAERFAEQSARPHNPYDPDHH